MTALTDNTDEVEYIIQHYGDDNVGYQYLCKWVGFDIEAASWESAEEIEAQCPDAVESYWRKYKLGELEDRESLDNINLVSDPWTTLNEIDTWEDAIQEIATVERSRKSGLIVYVIWKNGMKTVHHSSELYRKCPQKVISYFESKLSFKPISS
ncbi:uncharacterized protein BYT42DRAFT_559041 [Radiomyces spectabilis]|uniref:uncharacterized protein n=1 Tax=Radiomyces spectabilis TaxID=64574 RepID=UPI002220BEE6|nr:uncharacterized protein BYT42DRAFT_559041 [Radiomyces spectabilis]KAI8388127.1 hypothetical protein BYT42DRAFT_559041 [Radiomyces spectabilis]